MSWWSKATEAQKLAQIDGGIECGMTGPQVAMASGTTRSAVHSFAIAHGRKFPMRTGTASRKRMGKWYHDRAAFARGDRVNFWGNTEPEDEFALDPIPAHVEEIQ